MDLCSESEIEIDGDDDAFRKFIVICEDDKENSSRVTENEEKTNSTEKRQNTNKEQFNKIIQFTNGNNYKFILMSWNEDMKTRENFSI